MNNDLLEGWRSWRKDKPKSGLVQVLFLQSNVFPVGAIVQADVTEVEIGVIGDTNPDFWRPCTPPAENNEEKT